MFQAAGSCSIAFVCTFLMILHFFRGWAFPDGSCSVALIGTRCKYEMVRRKHIKTELLAGNVS